MIDKRKKYFCIIDTEKNDFGYIIADKKGKIYRTGHSEKDLERHIKEFNIKKIYAYNYQYDKRKIKSDFIKSLEWLDVWNVTCQTLGKQKSFFKFCEKNHCFTSNGNIKTDLETFYRYINNDMNCKQEHTSVSDCIITLDVLTRCWKQHKKINKNNGAFWRYCKFLRLKFSPDNFWRGSL